MTFSQIRVGSFGLRDILNGLKMGREGSGGLIRPIFLTLKKKKKQISANFIERMNQIRLFVTNLLLHV